MSSIIIAGDTSGSVEINVPAIAGSTVLELPNQSGMFATTDMVGGFKNKIIGGDFTTNPWQRGVSFTSPASSSYTADRFVVNYVTSGTFNITREVDSPSPIQSGTFTQHCLNLAVTSADTSIAAGDDVGLQHRVEGFNSASFGFGVSSNPNKVTLSFWHKHSKVGTYCVSIRNSDNTRSYVSEYTQSSSNVWEKAVITIPVDQSGTWLYDSGIGLKIGFSIVSGTTYQTPSANTWQAGNYTGTSSQVNGMDSTSNTFKFALIQLEAGSIATPFESRNYGHELVLCQRYYFRLSNGRFGQSWNRNTTTAECTTHFPVTLRAAPTAIEQSGTAADYIISYLATATACSAVPTFQQASQYTAATIFTVASGLTAGQGSACNKNNANAFLAWGAEL